MPLVLLAERHGIDVADKMSARELSDKMQERWLRPTPHQYQIPYEEPSEEDIAILRELGLVEGIKAPSGDYDGAFLLGGTVVAVRKRLAWLWAQPIKVPRVFMLGGMRPLDPVKENADVLMSPSPELPFEEGWQPSRGSPETEAEMMFLVVSQSNAPDDQSFNFVNAHLQPKPGGGTRHPNTTDTVKAMLSQFYVPSGRYLVVSSQPFVARQTINVRDAIPMPRSREIQVEGIGYSAPVTTSLKTFLDETARLLFEELKAG
jgi:hypothetical protein